jgi:hypothetical protein
MAKNVNIENVRCANCGRYIPYSQMEPGCGAKFHYTPLNEFGPEVIEWTCKACESKVK